MTTYGYDTKGNVTKVTPPAPLGATTIDYDGLSRPVAVTDGKGQRTTTSYDALDRVTQTTFADGLSVTSRYDPGGRLLERSDATGLTTYAYDRLNRVVQERLAVGGTNAYSYDAVGNLTSMTDGAGTVSYGYNAVNLATSVVEPGGATTTFAYDNDDNRTTTTYPNGVVQSATYDASSRLKAIEGKRGSTTLTRFSYTYTKPGTTTDTALRHSVKDKANTTTTYTYDPLDRLIRARGVSSLGLVTDDYRYGYDAAGNRTSETVPGLLLGTVTTESTFNAADQLTSRGDVTYSYDANGNQSGSSAGQALIYNAADQTKSLKKAGGSTLSAAYAGPNQVERTSAGATTFTNTLLGVTSATSSAITTATTRDPAGGLVGLRSGSDRFYYLLRRPGFGGGSDGRLGVGEPLLHLRSLRRDHREHVITLGQPLALHRSVPGHRHRAVQDGSSVLPARIRSVDPTGSIWAGCPRLSLRRWKSSELRGPERALLRHRNIRRAGRRL